VSKETDFSAFQRYITCSYVTLRKKNVVSPKLNPFRPLLFGLLLHFIRNAFAFILLNDVLGRIVIHDKRDYLKKSESQGYGILCQGEFAVRSEPYELCSLLGIIFFCIFLI